MSQNQPENLDAKVPKRAALVASLCAVSLACVKFAVGLLSGSVAVLSSALDSLMDFVISVLNFFALKKSSQKRNEEYNFGFDKIEALMGLLEALFIGAMAVFIFFESVRKLYAQEGVQNLPLSVSVMVLAMVVTAFLTLFLSRVAKKSRSLILQADCLHYKTDFFTNLATLLALLVISFTGWAFIDGVFGVAVSFYILFSAFKITKKSVEMLLDKALDDSVVARVKEIIASHKNVVSFHELKTRVSPHFNYISVHLVFCPVISLMQAHKISDEIEEEIKSEFKDHKFSIQIHLDPFDDSHE